MKTAAVVTQAHGQTVCLPQDFRLDGDEVYVKKVGRSIMLIPKQVAPWQSLVDSLDQFSEDYMQNRAQPDPQPREASRSEPCSPGFVPRTADDGRF